MKYGNIGVCFQIRNKFDQFAGTFLRGVLDKVG